MLKYVFYWKSILRIPRKPEQFKKGKFNNIFPRVKLKLYLRGLLKFEFQWKIYGCLP